MYKDKKTIEEETKANMKWKNLDLIDKAYLLLLFIAGCTIISMGIAFAIMMFKNN